MYSYQTHQSGPMYFERQYNLMYILSNPEDGEEKSGGGGFWSKKGSVGRKSGGNQYHNILLYDIPKDLQIWLFKPGELSEDEYVSNLVFELFYEKKHSNMVFSIHAGNCVVNNFDIEQRPVSDRLLIATYSEAKEETRLWLTDKWGFEKQVFATLKKGAFWQLDTYNSMVRIFEKKENGQFKVQNFDY